MDEWRLVESPEGRWIGRLTAIIVFMVVHIAVKIIDVVDWVRGRRY